MHACVHVKNTQSVTREMWYQHGFQHHHKNTNKRKCDDHCRTLTPAQTETLFYQKKNKTVEKKKKKSNETDAL